MRKDPSFAGWSQSLGHERQQLARSTDLTRRFTLIDPYFFTPDEDAPLSSLVYTFGGVPAATSLRSGTVLSTRTLDCFAGLVRSRRDLPSQKLDPRYLNQ
jgi:hypothetical protein